MHSLKNTLKFETYHILNLSDMHNEPFHAPIHLDCSNFQHNSNPEKNLYYETKKAYMFLKGGIVMPGMEKLELWLFFSRRRIVVLSKYREEIKTLIN